MERAGEAGMGMGVQKSAGDRIQDSVDPGKRSVGKGIGGKTARRGAKPVETDEGMGCSYFTLIDEEIPPANNAVEQAIRAIVTDRKVTD
jgi:hypothetical protein